MAETFGDGPKDAEYAKAYIREIAKIVNTVTVRSNPRPARYMAVVGLANVLRTILDSYPVSTRHEVLETMVIPFLRHDAVEKGTIITLH
jgi:hypothetical protein